MENRKNPGRSRTHQPALPDLRSGARGARDGCDILRVVPCVGGVGDGAVANSAGAAAVWWADGGVFEGYEGCKLVISDFLSLSLVCFLSPSFDFGP